MITPGTWVAECVGAGGDYDNPTDIYEITNGYARIAEHCLEDDAQIMAAAPEMLDALELAYLYILKTDGVLRVKNQHVFCAVRDALAKATAREPMDVQDEFEAIRISLAEGQS